MWVSYPQEFKNIHRSRSFVSMKKKGVRCRNISKISQVSRFGPPLLQKVERPRFLHVSYQDKSLSFIAEKYFILETLIQKNLGPLRNSIVAFRSSDENPSVCRNNNMQAAQVYFKKPDSSKLKDKQMKNTFFKISLSRETFINLNI